MKRALKAWKNPRSFIFPTATLFRTIPTNFQNHIDEGGGLFRDTLRNEYPTPLPPYAAGPGWWDGDRNTDQYRPSTLARPKASSGWATRAVDQTFEYSFDFRMDPAFVGTSQLLRCLPAQSHRRQRWRAVGHRRPLQKRQHNHRPRRLRWRRHSASGTVRTFSFTAGQWIHVDIRITTCQSTESTGSVVASINGDPFSGFTNQPISSTSSTDYRPKFGLYRGMGTDYGVPAGDSWVEHDAVTGYIGTSNVLTWNGTAGVNTWDNNTTQSFLNGASAAVV